MDMVLDLVEVCGKFGLAIVLAGAVGLERQRKRRGAGLRTHILVCLGATLLMVVADLMARRLGGLGGWTEQARIAAGIITGIGFLGAGTIMTVGSEQRGLTTAALIWFVAALGIAIGAGFHLVAVCATCFALLVVVILGRLERVLPAYERIVATIRMPEGLQYLKEIETTIRQAGFQVTASRIKITGENGQVDVVFELTAPAGPKIEQLATDLRERFTSAEKITFER